MKEKHQFSKLNAMWKFHLNWHQWRIFWLEFFFFFFFLTEEEDEATFKVN